MVLGKVLERGNQPLCWFSHSGPTFRLVVVGVSVQPDPLGRGLGRLLASPNNAYRIPHRPVLLVKLVCLVPSPFGVVGRLANRLAGLAVNNLVLVGVQG